MSIVASAESALYITQFKSSEFSRLCCDNPSGLSVERVKVKQLFDSPHANCLLYASFLHASLSPGKKQQQFSHLFTFNSTLQSHVGNSENVMPSKTVNASSYRRKSYGKITYGFFCNFSPHHCSVILNILTSNSVAYLQVFFTLHVLFLLPTDVNECNNRPCQHTCTNTFGSFTCSCNSCYTKVGLKCDLRQCKINNQCYAYGRVNPSNQCQVRF